MKIFAFSIKHWNRTTNLLKNKFFIILLLIILLSTSCKNTDDNSISLSYDHITLKIGKSHSIYAYSIHQIEYHSTNDSIATVDDYGTITALFEGSCDIILDNKHETQTLTVNIPPLDFKEPYINRNGSPENIEVFMGSETHHIEHTENIDFLYFIKYHDAAQIVYWIDNSNNTLIKTECFFENVIFERSCFQWLSDNYEYKDGYFTTNDGNTAISLRCDNGIVVMTFAANDITF